MTPDRPNIIYIVCHDLGRHLGCYGIPIQTPNLDRLASEGALFTRAFTNAVACSPSRGCAMSGMYSHSNGLMGLVNCGWSMPESTPTIVDYLNSSGYETAHFGFQHERYKPEANRYAVGGSWGWDEWYVEHAAARALEFLKTRDRDKPLYLNLGTWEVHPSRWQSKTGGERLALYRPVPPEDAYVPEGVPDLPQFRYEMGHLQGCVQYFDEQVGIFLEGISRLGYEDNTLVVFTTDHGLPGMRAKTSLYRRGVETALMMKMPGAIEPGIQIDHMVQNIDMTPTLLDAAGASIPDILQGRSYWGAVTGGHYTPHERIFLERNHHAGYPYDSPLPPGSTKGYDPIRSVRTDRFTYLRNLDPNAKREWLPGEVEPGDTYSAWYDDMWPTPSLPREPEELFDVEADPSETTNLAYEPGYEQIKAELSEHVDRWMAETDDPVLRGPIPDRMNGWPPIQPNVP